MTTPEHRPQPDRESGRPFSPETAAPGPETSAYHHSSETPAHRHSRENGNPEHTPANATSPAAADRLLGNGELVAPPARIPFYRDFILLQLAAIVFLADQFTKFLVREFIPFGYSWPLWLGRDIFQFTHTHNTGSIFGILQGQNTPLIFVSFLGVFVLLMIYRSQPRPTHLLRLSLGLQLGGAFGNLIDRLRLGAVTDFIDVSRWPVFNLADASVVTGLLLLAWFLLRANRQDAAAIPPSTDPTDAANPLASDPTPTAAAAIEPPDPADPTDREPSQ